MTRTLTVANLKGGALNRSVLTGGSAPVRIRTKPVRLTVDVDPDLHRRARRWAFERDVALVDAMRMFLTELVDDPELSKRYEERMKK